jgi:phosphoserine phosphatase RsbU/P
MFASIRDISERARMEREIRAREIQLEAAREIQRHLLPKEAPVVPGFDIAGGLYAADYAAGDFFDFIPAAQNRLGIVVGDVCGKGFPAAILSATTHELLRAGASVHSTAQKIVTHANVVLAGETEDFMFVTLTLVMLDIRSRKVEYVSAGHPDGYVLDRQGNIKHRLSHSAGLLALSAEDPFEEGPPVQLEAGDLLFLVTDGVLEAHSANRADGAFGEARTLAVVRRHLDKPSKDIVTAIHQAVQDFSENQRAYDDVTIVVVKCL